MLFAVLLWTALAAAETVYVGGTLALAQNASGRLRLDPDSLVFRAKPGEFRIPYDRVTSLEYGQKAGRRLGLAVAVSPLFLLSKKRRHYLSIGYGTEAAVLRLEKGQVRDLIAELQRRSGKTVEYESEDARRMVERK